MRSKNKRTRITITTGISAKIPTMKYFRNNLLTLTMDDSLSTLKKLIKTNTNRHFKSKLVATLDIYLDLPFCFNHVNTAIEMVKAICHRGVENWHTVYCSFSGILASK